MRCWYFAVLASVAPLGVTGQDEVAQSSFDEKGEVVQGALRGRELAQVYQVESHHNCRGMETTWDTCPNLQPCAACVPEDCVFAQWGLWSADKGDCLGLCHRKRIISQHNNHCGAPCHGATQESKACPEPGCTIVAQDCSLGAWRTWSTCDTKDAQSTRTRVVTAHASDGGKGCNVPLSETKPCGAPDDIACSYYEWESWTTCSATCGAGHIQRTRRMKTRSLGVGKSCDGVISEESSCSATPCDKVVCSLATWGEWTGCSQPGAHQAIRKRAYSIGTGPSDETCAANLREVKPCIKGRDCTLSAWNSWSQCNAECGGGQQLRLRSISSPPKHGGECANASLSEVTACGTGPCDTAGGANNCQLSPWLAWSTCSKTCGKGISERTRTVVSEAKQNFFGCGSNIAPQDLKINRECQETPCPKTDCAWADWNEWEACSARCGGGSQQRTRTIAQLALKGGAGCKAEAKVVNRACNNQSCVPCIDGKWGDWGRWSHCSATCGGGYTARTRGVGTVPNLCGKPATGAGTDSVNCGMAPCPSNDCEVSSWDQWSQCSSSCHGVRERKRNVLRNAQGEGAACKDRLREIGPCFMGTQSERKSQCQGLRLPTDCEFGSWSSWSECTQSGSARAVRSECGTGQRSRDRSILTPVQMDGIPCQGDTSVTEECELKCTPICVDCELGPWSQWSVKDFQPHQKKRSREVLTMANECGKLCPKGAPMTETIPSNENPSMTLTSCQWLIWGDWSKCTDQCTAFRTRDRSFSPRHFAGSPDNVLLSMFLDTSFDGKCREEKQVESGPNCKPCAAPSPCIPHDLSMKPWSNWTTDASNPTLCSRTRAGPVLNASEAKNECGSYGDHMLGAKEESKSCDPSSNWTACHIGAYGSPDKECKKITDQPFRTRELPDAFPDKCRGFAGDLKDGEYKEGLSCVNELRPITDCVLEPWSTWGACTKPDTPCEGFQRRSALAKIPENAGKACAGATEQSKACDTCVHKQWCKFGDWSNATEECSFPKKVELTSCHMVKERDILTSGDASVTVACSGAMKEILKVTPPADCVLPDWTHWSVCDKTCHGGYSRRQRKVKQHSERGGSTCPKADVSEVKACNDEVRCPTDAYGYNCQLGSWGTWSQCSTSCGTGTEKRGRNVAVPRKPAPGYPTKGCDGDMSESRSCGGSPCKAFFDCDVADWSLWGKCSAPCGGGQTSRSRDISQKPVNGGAACAAKPAKELHACNQQSCDKVCIPRNAQWGPWSLAGGCSSTCNGGFQKRNRSLIVEANECGSPGTGLSEDAQPCNSAVVCILAADCTFNDWSAWNNCTLKSTDDCNGLQKRSRTTNPRRGDGEVCKGVLEEAKSCTPAVQTTTCKPVIVDCKLADWSGWNHCTHTCGGGQTERERTKLAGNARGVQCDGGLKEVTSCGLAPCKGTEDCKFSDWASWGSCQSCGGQRTRQRHVAKYPAGAGKQCADSDLEETEQCPRNCNQLYCGWTTWRDWGECSAKCGSGKRSRTRILGLVEKPKTSETVTKLYDANTMDEHTLEDRVQELYRRSQNAEANRHSELFLAFGLGAFSLLALASFSLACSRNRKCRISTSRSTSRALVVGGEYSNEGPTHEYSNEDGLQYI